MKRWADMTDEERRAICAALAEGGTLLLPSDLYALLTREGTLQKFPVLAGVTMRLSKAMPPGAVLVLSNGQGRLERVE